MLASTSASSDTSSSCRDGGGLTVPSVTSLFEGAVAMGCGPNPGVVCRSSESSSPRSAGDDGPGGSTDLTGSDDESDAFAFLFPVGLMIYLVRRFHEFVDQTLDASARHLTG